MKKIGICLVPQNLDVGRIQTQIVRVEVAHADHLTTTTTLQMFIFTLIRLNFKDLLKDSFLSPIL